MKARQPSDPKPRSFWRDPARWLTRSGANLLGASVLGFSSFLICFAGLIGLLADQHFSTGIERSTDQQLEAHAALAAVRFGPGVLSDLLNPQLGPDDPTVRYFHSIIQTDAQVAGLRRIVIFERSGLVALDSLDITNRGRVDSRLRVDAVEIEQAVRTNQPVTSVLYDLPLPDGTTRKAKTSYAPVPPDPDQEVSPVLIAAVELPLEFGEQLVRLRTVIWSTWLFFSLLVAIATAMTLTVYSRMIRQYEGQRRRAEMWDLAAAVAHEFKNPIAAMKLALQMVRKPKVSDELRRDLHGRLERNVELLNKIVVDFLAFARGIKYEPEVATLGQIVADVRQNLTPEQDRILQADCEPLLEIETVPRALSQAIANLTKNACDAALDRARTPSDAKPDLATADTSSTKSTLLIPAGPSAAPPKVWLTAQPRGANLVIEVEDNGSGIPQDVRERLFQPFVTGKTGGSGLGLAIATRLISDLGGSLTLLGTGPGGTKFRATIPLRGGRRCTGEDA